jgi:hypothetical protein
VIKFPFRTRRRRGWLRKFHQIFGDKELAVPVRLLQRKASQDFLVCRGQPALAIGGEIILVLRPSIPVTHPHVTGISRTFHIPCDAPPDSPTPGWTPPAYYFQAGIADTGNWPSGTEYFNQTRIRQFLQVMRHRRLRDGNRATILPHESSSVARSHFFEDFKAPRIREGPWAMR